MVLGAAMAAVARRGLVLLSPQLCVILLAVVRVAKVVASREGRAPTNQKCLSARRE